MLLIALTGGIACGKSAVGRILAQDGVPVCEADVLAHKAMEPGKPAYGRIVERFGESVLTNDKRVDRKRLGQRVFERTDERRLLESIVHPEVRQAWKAWAAAQASSEAAVVIVPLLFECVAKELWNATICVTAPLPRRLQWLAERGLTPDDAAKRMTAQMSLRTKMERSDRVIVNSGGWTALREQTRRAWTNLINNLNKGRST